MKPLQTKSNTRRWTRTFLACFMSLALAACGGSSSDFVDEDGDGWAPEADCNDADPSIHPLAQEIPYDGIDQDCDGEDLTDVDRDGYDAIEAGGTDCDDGDARRAPGNPEVPYDGIDQDCDGEDLTDVDGDGFDSVRVGGSDCCDLGDEPVLGCNASTAAGIHPDAEEIPNDGIDQNCDGQDSFVLEGDADGDGYISASLPGGLDCDDTDPEIYPGAIERCNLIDDDCDGDIDEGLLDWDGDGAPACLDCDDWDPTRRPHLGDDNPWFDIPNNNIDEDCDGVDLQDVDGDGWVSDLIMPVNGDCNDNDPEIYPGAPERCNNIDDNCDGQIDEGLDNGDDDGDGYKNCMDCAPTNPAVSPGVVEIPGNGIDDNCNGYIDEQDFDGDGVLGGDLAGLAPDCCDTGTEEGVPGCDPTTANTIAGGEFARAEIPYDGIDQDCSGADLTDVDGDGFDSILVEGGNDCNDGNAQAYPGHAEDCLDPADNNCDGTVNEDCGPGMDEDVLVPAGVFIRGRNAEDAMSLDQAPARPITMDAFYIDKYEVTISQYWRCVAADYCEFGGIDIWASASDPFFWYNQEKGLHPALFLTHAQAQRYCEWVGKQLPTEAQWEMAARGSSPDERTYPWGDPTWSTPPAGGETVRDALSCEIANHADLCTGEPCEGDVVAVDAYLDGVSPFGVYNLAGNVREWVADWYHPDYYNEMISPSENPLGPASSPTGRRVVRGGGWNQHDYLLEVTARESAAPNTRENNLGFRCARTPPLSWEDLNP